QDGSEIHEATLTMFFLDKAEVKITCLAPKIKQYHTIDHLTGKIQEKESRQVLTESARIARGEIIDLAEANVESLDGLIFPGGFGAAKNLSDFAFNEADCQINKDVESIIQSMHTAGKPQGFICIAPVLAARVLGSFHPRLTIGNDQSTAQLLEQMGARHIISKVDEIVYDPDHKIASTPAYMLDPSISKVAVGIERLVQKILEVE
ncbi:MAG: isoprenoid biosynthesis glyoxalase ElbB, partial [Atribacterota bacterium]